MLALFQQTKKKYTKKKNNKQTKETKQPGKKKEKQIKNKKQQQNVRKQQKTTKIEADTEQIHQNVLFLGETGFCVFRNQKQKSNKLQVKRV